MSRRGNFRGPVCNKVMDLWELACKLNKPIHPDVTWAVSLINGRGYFGDLQVQGLALASSIIINEPVVPKIIIAWDTPNDGTTLSQSPIKKSSQYPWYLLRAFNPNITTDSLIKEKFAEHFYFSNKYVDLYRSWLSVNPQQWSLSLGYRAKYLGLNYVTTKYGISGDCDTICRKPCVDFMMKAVSQSPESFVWTVWHNEIYITVGLCLYHMEKYRNYFFPRLCRESWNLHRQDSRYVKSIVRKYPDMKDILDVREFGDVKMHTEKFYPCKARGNIWDDERTLNYHAFKYEPGKNYEGFFETYNKILDDLAESAKAQLGSK